MQVQILSPYTLSFLNIGSEIFENILTPSHPRYHTEDYQEYLSSLESRLQQLCHRHQKGHESKIDRILFPQAALIYFERMSKSCSGHSSKIDGWAESAFGILSETRAVRHPFLLFLLGLEARTDDRRIIILQTIQQSSKTMNSKNIELLLGLLQSAWNQDDLTTNRDVPYDRKLDVIFSTYKSAPAFL